MLFKSNFYWSLTFTHLLHLQQSWWALFSRSETVCRVLRPSVVVPVFVAVRFLHGSGRKGLRPASGQVCRREKLAWKYFLASHHNLNTTGLVWSPSMSEPGKIVCNPVIYRKADRVVLAIRYHPKLPSISKIIQKHWNTLVRDYELKKVFPNPPMVTFKQPPNLRSTSLLFYIKPT